MDDNNLIICPECTFEYSAKKHQFCPNCNLGRAKKNPLIRWSELALNMPLGVRIAILLTSTYALFALCDQLTRLPGADLGAIVLYEAFIYFWFRQRDAIERPVWFLAILLTMYLPVIALLSLIAFI